MLVSSPHLARSYHHLFPMADFILVNNNSNNAEEDADALEIAIFTCGACHLHIETDSFCFKCPKCTMKYCKHCADYIQSSLHFCPNCT